MNYKKAENTVKLFKSSKEIDRWVVFDIDNTVALFDEIFVDYVLKVGGKTLGIEPYTTSVFDACDHVYGVDRSMELINNFYTTYHGVNKLKVYAGAPAFTKFLKKLGYNIHFATCRPGDSFPDLRIDTLKWLCNNGFEFNSLDFVPTKSGLGTEYTTNNIKPVAFDDRIDQVNNLSGECRTVFMPDWPRTSNDPIPFNVVRFTDYNDIKDWFINDSI